MPVRDKKTAIAMPMAIIMMSLVKAKAFFFFLVFFLMGKLYHALNLLFEFISVSMFGNR